MTNKQHFGPDIGWAMLARLADLALRQRVAVDYLSTKTARRTSHDEPREYHIKLQLLDLHAVLEAFRELPDTELGELAERQMTLWGERAQHLLRAADGLPPLPTCANWECPTCGVYRGTWCKPVHAGERDAGGWMHPARERWCEHEMRPHPRAVEVAINTLRGGGSLGDRTFAGLPGARSCAHMLAMTVLAYARHDIAARNRGGPSNEKIVGHGVIVPRASIQVPWRHPLPTTDK